MQAHSTTVSARSSRKRAAKKIGTAALATCPVGGAGWCPYPFSLAQLEKHLKLKAESSAEAASTSGQKRRTASAKGR